MRPPVLSASKELLNTKRTTTLHVSIGELLTSVMFTIFYNLAIDFVLCTTFIDQQIFAILSEEQRVIIRKSTPGVIVTDSTCLLMQYSQIKIGKMQNKDSIRSKRRPNTDNETHKYSCGRQAEVA